MEFAFLHPKTANKEAKEKKGVEYKTTKPDVDNLMKPLFDAMEGIIFKDDAAIVKCNAEKVFGSYASVTMSIQWTT